MKLRSAYKAVSASYYWRLYHTENGTPVAIPASGRHWNLFQKACIKLGRAEVIDQYVEDLDNAIDGKA